MIKRTIWATALLTTFAGAHAQSLGASNDYVIEDMGGGSTGGYTYNDTTNFMNFGVVSGYKSFAVLDFNAQYFGNVTSVTSATLLLQESDYSSTKPLNLTFWAVTDNVTNLHKGQMTVTYDDTVTGGYSGQLGTATELGTYDDTSSGATNGDQNDVINFTSGLSAIAGLINSSNNVIRILVTTDETGYGTFAGAGSSSKGVPTLFDPTLELVETPEPASMAFLGLGIVGLIVRKRRK